MENGNLHLGVLNPLSDAVLGYLSERAQITCCHDWTDTWLMRNVGKFDGILVRSATKVSEKLLTAGKEGKLRVVGTATAGVDHIDLWAAERLGVTVVNSTWGNSLANAEFIIGMMIALSRNFIGYDKQMRCSQYYQEWGIGPELSGKTFGTVGFGRIGSLAAEKARLLGMKVMAYDPYQPHSAFFAKSIIPMTLPELLKEADFVSLSIPLYEDTYKLIGAEELALMKPSSYIIQSSRGGIIDEEALIEALRTKKIAGASIDVFESEWHINPAFKQLDNTILTPHIGCSSRESRTRSGMSVAEDVLRVLEGGPATNRVRPLDDQNFHRLLG